MSIIEEVRREREELARVLKKHVGIRKIVEELYPDSAHFIYELLQNAEDTAATEACFTLSRDSLIFEHNGRPFTREDIFAITDIGEGTKADDNDKIGRFGVGFKAVFAYSETPLIWSPTFSFKISDLVLPDEIDPLPDASNKTRFKFPFNNPKKSPNDAFTEIEDGLNEIAETTLLFLTHLKLIVWRIDQNPPGDVQRIFHSKNHFEVLKRIDEKTISSSHYLKFDQPVEGLEKQRVAVAFTLDFLPNVTQFDPHQPLDKQLKIVAANPGRVAVFFPAKAELSGLRFHLHAPFVPELSRASIKETPANLPLFEQLAMLTAFSLHEIRDLKLLTGEFLGVLPNPQDSISARYQVIRRIIVNEMNCQWLTPTHSKTHAPAKRLIQAKSLLKDLLSEVDIKLLVDPNKEQPQWAIAATQKNNNVDKFLNGLSITEWDVDEFVEVISDKASEYHTEPDKEFMSWLSSKTNDWHQQFYALLYRELEPDDTFYRLDDSLIIRLSNGSYGVGKKCFFPNDSSEYDEILPRVDAEVYLSGKSKTQQENARKFLEKIGVREVGELEQVEAILESRYGSEDVKPDIRDLNRFIELVENDPKNSKIFSDYYVFEGSDGEWRQPSQIYLDKPYRDSYLASYYDVLGEEADCCALHGRYEKCGITLERLNNFAQSVGAKTSLEIKKVSCYQNPEAYYLVYSAFGSRTRYEFDEDYNIESIEKIIVKKSINLSMLIWKSIISFSHAWTKACYRKNSAYSYRYRPSQLALILKKHAWIPQGDDIFVRPNDASAKLLPKGFPIDKGWEWLKDIGFGENEEKKIQDESRQTEASRQRETLIRDFGFADEESLKRAQRFAALSPEDQESFLADREYRKTLELPEREPSNAEHRAQRVVEQAVVSPEKLTEERTRSVSIGREAVKEEAGQYLREQYTNGDSEMICQICKAALPFTLDDGTPYFEKVEFLTDLKKRHYQNYLALCPNHSAMFQHVNGSSGDMREMFVDVTGNELKVVLAQKESTIYFTKTHIHDLRSVLKVDDGMSASPISATNNKQSDQNSQSSQNSQLQQEVIIRNNSSTNSLPKMEIGNSDSRNSSTLITSSKVPNKVNNIKVFMHPRISKNNNMDKISSELKSCPYCHAEVAQKNFDKHVKEKCPRRPLPSKTVSTVTNSSRISRCRYCDMPAMPGSDTCYSCG